MKPPKSVRTLSVEKDGIQPCPFCGSTRAALWCEERFPGLPRDWDGSLSYFVACDSCASQGAWAKSPVDGADIGEKGAIRNWNMRPDMEQKTRAVNCPLRGGLDEEPLCPYYCDPDIFSSSCFHPEYHCDELGDEYCPVQFGELLVKNS